MERRADVSLRPVIPDDAQVMSELYASNWDYLRPWSPRRDDGSFGVEQCRLDLERECGEHAAGTASYFMVIADGAPVGRVSLTNVARRVWQNANIGYWIAEAYAGRGIMTAAVRLAVDFAFGPGALHRVQAAVMPRNAASVRVVEKVGMRREGLALRYLCINDVWEDHLIFAVTAEEWAGLSAPPEV